MLEILKAAVNKAAEIWTGVPRPNLDEWGRSTSVTLPNGATVEGNLALVARHQLKWAPVGVVEDLYESTLPEAERNRRAKYPMALVSEFVTNARAFYLSCTPNEQSAADAIYDLSKDYLREHGLFLTPENLKAAERRYVEAATHIGRNLIAPAKYERSGSWVRPEGNAKAELREASFENLKDIATAIGKFRDPTIAHQHNFTHLWFCIGHVEAGEYYHRV